MQYVMHYAMHYISAVQSTFDLLAELKTTAHVDNRLIHTLCQ